MQEFHLDPEEADNFEENLHRLNEAVHRWHVEQVAFSDALQALTDRVVQLERDRK